MEAPSKIRTFYYIETKFVKSLTWFITQWKKTKKVMKNRFLVISAWFIWLGSALPKFWHNTKHNWKKYGLVLIKEMNVFTRLWQKCITGYGQDVRVDFQIARIAKMFLHSRIYSSIFRVNEFKQKLLFLLHKSMFSSIFLIFQNSMQTGILDTALSVSSCKSLGVLYLQNKKLTYLIQMTVPTAVTIDHLRKLCARKRLAFHIRS